MVVLGCDGMAAGLSFSSAFSVLSDLNSNFGIVIGGEAGGLLTMLLNPMSSKADAANAARYFKITAPAAIPKNELPLGSYRLMGLFPQ